MCEAKTVDAGHTWRDYSLLSRRAGSWAWLRAARPGRTLLAASMCGTHIPRESFRRDPWAVAPERLRAAWARTGPWRSSSFVSIRAQCLDR